jgi:hypothetical protein
MQVVSSLMASGVITDLMEGAQSEKFDSYKLMYTLHNAMGQMLEQHKPPAKNLGRIDEKKE